MNNVETFGESYFEGASSNYASYRLLDNDRHWKPILTAIKKFLKPGTDTIKAIDIGCAYGYLLKRLKNIFYGENRKIDVFGADISDYALTQAKKDNNNLVRMDLNDTLKDGSIPFAGKLFQVVTALDILEHTKARDWNLGDIHRILDDDGLLIVQVPVKDTWMGYLFRKLLDRDNTHVNVPGKTEFLKELKDNGFKVLEIQMFAVQNDVRITFIPEIMQIAARKV